MKNKENFNKNVIGFDNEKYLNLQSKKILERLSKSGEKLYLEFGGKLFDDNHAARVLPGYDADLKTKLLLKLGNKAEIIFCVSAIDIEKHRTKSDLGLSYDNQLLKILNNLRDKGLYVSAVVITLFKGQTSAIKFAERLKSDGERVFFHKYTKGYPSDIETIVSEEGYGANPFIETSRPIVVVAAPGPASGKLATCLSQMYHEFKNGRKAGYAKFETFPVWNLPLKHPVNIAYEAATSDIKEINQIDPYHFSEYGTLTINYNRSIDSFPVIKNILKKITGEQMFKSPTEMGVNVVAEAICDEKEIEKAANKEIIRRYFKAEADYKRGIVGFDTVERNRYLMSELDLDVNQLQVVPASKEMARQSGYPCIALQLKNGTIVYGKNKTMVSASGAVILNALRILANLDDGYDIIADDILLPIISLRRDVLNSKTCLLSVDDVLISLAVSAQHNRKAKKALSFLSQLEGCEAHCTYLLSQAEEQTLKKLGIHVTSEPISLGGNLIEE